MRASIVDYWRDLNDALAHMGRPGASLDTAEACAGRLHPYDAARFLPARADHSAHVAERCRLDYARSGSDWHRQLAVEYACASGLSGPAAVAWVDAVVR